MEMPPLLRRLWHGRCCMTNTYAHQGPFARPVTSPEAMKLQWSHSVLFERDYLNEWQAQEHASTLAAELGSSVLPRVDTITLSLRQRSNPCRVRFNDDITVLIGEDSGIDLRPTTITHHALQDLQTNPGGFVPFRSSLHENDATSFMQGDPHNQCDHLPLQALLHRRPLPPVCRPVHRPSVPMNWRQTV